MDQVGTISTFLEILTDPVLIFMLINIFLVVFFVVSSEFREFVFKRLRQTMSISVGSASERLSEDDTDRLIELRRRIDREKDHELAIRLKQEAEQFEKRLLATKRSSLWSEDGILNVTWKETIAVTRERLILESDRLNARSRANLRVGILTSTLGIVILVIVIFVFPPQNQSDTWTSVVTGYGPRFALVLIIELMATFFFRMYVANENDIKHNKNELTNVEQKLAASLMIAEDDVRFKTLAEHLIKDERNFVIKKGERVSGDTTGEDINRLSQLVTKISTALKSE